MVVFVARRTCKRRTVDRCGVPNQARFAEGCLSSCLAAPGRLALQAMARARVQRFHKQRMAVDETRAYCLSNWSRIIGGALGTLAEEEGFVPASERSELQAARRSLVVQTGPLGPGGGGGIRTHGTLASTPVFKTGAFSRSATPPWSAGLVARFSEASGNS